jgi:hypothetical protein
MDEFYNKYIKEPVKKMSDKDECYPIFNYYSGKTGYKYINKFLLMDENEELFVKRFKQDIGVIKKSIKQMDECFNKAPVTKDDEMLLWRGMDKDLGLKIGDSIVLKNYTSCTSNLGVTLEFTEENITKRGKRTGRCCLYRIHVGEGISYLPLDKYSKAGSIEAEVLLPRNLVMTYIEDETIGKTGQYKRLFPDYKLTVRHMKITKLNDTISDNKIIDMGEPIIHKEEKPVSPIKENTISDKKMIDMGEPIMHKEEKPVSPIKETIKILVKRIKEKKNKTQKNKESLISICPEGCIPINDVIKEQTVEPNSENKKRCPKGTRKNKDGLCVKT